MFEKHPEVQKKEIEKKKISTHMRVSTFDKCNLYQNCNENLALATTAPEDYQKYLKIQVFTFSKVVSDRCLRL